MVGEQHATDGLVHELGFMDRNYHAVGRHFAGFDYDLGNSLAERTLLLDGAPFVQLDCDLRQRRKFCPPKEAPARLKKLPQRGDFDGVKQKDHCGPSNIHHDFRRFGFWKQPPAEGFNEQRHS